MMRYPEHTFTIQTNGLLLDRLESEYLNRLDFNLASPSDGDETTTDHYQGKARTETAKRRGEDNPRARILEAKSSRE